MKNTLKTFQIVCRPDFDSQNLANTIQNLLSQFLVEAFGPFDGDLAIAIGGDGTFLRTVTQMGFDKSKIYAGINTGTLGFFQDIAPDEFINFCQFFSKEKELRTRKLHIPSIDISLKDGSSQHFHAINEIVIAGRHASKINFTEYVNDYLFQNVFYILSI